MQLFDVAVIAVLIATVALGAWAGFFPQVLGLVGAAAGFIAALVIAGAFQRDLAAIQQPMRAFLAAALLVGLTLIGEALGSAIGSRIRLVMRATLLGGFDAAGGMIVGLAQGVLAVWLIGGMILAGALPALQVAAARSVVLKAVDQVLPPPEGVAAQVVSLLAPTAFPQLFAGVEPSPAPPLDMPADAQVAALARSAEASTVQVVAVGCGGEQLGTGFFAASHAVVTNAHVVAGTDSETVVIGGASYRATLILFDARHDIAVLRVPDASAPALRLSDSVPQRGVAAAALGHPAGGPLTVIPAVVTASFDAAGPDIYQQGSVTRSIVELRASVRRGDSGGPLVTAPGVVGGVVFGASRVSPDVGYAISAASVANEIREGVTRGSAVDSGSCAAG